MVCRLPARAKTAVRFCGALRRRRGCESARWNRGSAPNCPNFQGSLQRRAGQWSPSWPWATGRIANRPPRRAGRGRFRRLIRGAAVCNCGPKQRGGRRPPLTLHSILPSRSQTPVLETSALLKLRFLRSDVIAKSATSLRRVRETGFRKPDIDSQTESGSQNCEVCVFL